MITTNNVDSSEVAAICELATKLEVECTSFEGSLMPHYILYNAEEIEVFEERAKYIIFQECYKNEWQSTYSVLLTNDINKVSEYQSEFEGNDLKELSI